MPVLEEAARCAPFRCLLPRFSGYFALSRVRRKPPMPQPGRLSASLSVRRVQPWTVHRRRGYPAPPVHFHEPEETPFHAAPRVCARSASGHRPHVGATLSGVSGGTRRSMAQGIRAGICGDDFFLKTYPIARRMAAPAPKTVAWLHAVLTMHAGGHRFSPQCNGSYLRLHTIAISSNLV